MTYLAEVLADSPVHYWRCADGGGQLLHDIGSSVFDLVAGTLAGAYTGPNSDGGSIFCAAAVGGLSHDGLPTVNSPFSTEMWVWAHDLVQTGAAALLLAWDNVTNPTTNLVWNTNATFQASVSGTNQVSPVSTRQAWHHLVCTYDNVNIRLYVDAILAGPTAKAGPQNIARAIAIGGNTGNNANLFRGWVSEIALYASALSAARVNAHFLAADNVSSSPVIKGIGLTGGSGGGGPSNIADTLDQILNSVKRSY